jgi:hypothetical protein
MALRVSMTIRTAGDAQGLILYEVCSRRVYYKQRDVH